jgi:hypothetical protein
VRLRLWTLLVGLGAFCAPLSGQSLFSSAGIGLPIEPLDARARALGSVGIGLRDPGLLLADPAAAARLLLPTGFLAAQPSWTDLTQDGSSDHHYSRGNRFPLMGMAYPVARGMLTVQFTSVFDQRFQGRRSLSVDIQGSSVPTNDLFVQKGSISLLNVGYARVIDARTSVGLTFGRYSGSVDRSLTRTFGDSITVVQAQPYQSTGLWSYSGYAVTGGVSSDITGSLHVAASATWSTDLHANASSDSEGSDQAYSVPLQLRVGATAMVAPGLAVSASGARANWSGIRGDLGSTSSARSVVLAWGMGVELSQMRLLGRRAPLRLGFRHSDLPFSMGAEPASERSFSGGFALTLNETNGISLASTDLAIERGRRTDGTFTENFWRATLSLKLSGF